MSRRFWTENKIVSEIQRIHDAGEDLWYRAMERNHKDLIRASERYFKGWKNAVLAAGLDYDVIKKRSHQVWTEEKILKQLHELKINEPNLRSSMVQKLDKKLYHAAIRQYQNFSNAMSRLDEYYSSIGEMKLDNPLKSQPTEKSGHTLNKTNKSETTKTSRSSTSTVSTTLKTSKASNAPKALKNSTKSKTHKDQITPLFENQPRSNKVNEAKGELKTETKVEIEPESIDESELKIFTVRTRVRSERNVGEAITKRAKNQNIIIGTIQYPAILNGYIFVECNDRQKLKKLIKNVKNAQGLLNGETTKDEISKYVQSSRSRKKMIEGTRIEIIDGQFKGERAIIQHVNSRTKQLTVELMDEVLKMPITLDRSQCKILS